mmetsp:Transcript_31061/g.50132  ORF Transcript_31061/g.50132 Transcript_31061/m.50132 type:complete len:119 (-) Transcript_31061:162-518(-)
MSWVQLFDVVGRFIPCRWALHSMSLGALFDVVGSFCICTISDFLGFLKVFKGLPHLVGLVLTVAVFLGVVIEFLGLFDALFHQKTALDPFFFFIRNLPSYRLPLQIIKIMLRGGKSLV